MKKSTIIWILILVACSIEARDNIKYKHLADLMKPDVTRLGDYEAAVKRLIGRIIDNSHDLADFVVKIDPDRFNTDLDTFELETIDEKLKITANSPVAAAWGFNYYLKYYANSSVYWSGKNINVNNSTLPVVTDGKVRVTAKDYVRFNQNVCTYSYSYVWWGVQRWEYEIDWMALNGINLAYAHTGAEAAWANILPKFGLSGEDIDAFLPGPAYLAWFRMGNLKRFGGPLTSNWHISQGDLQVRLINTLF